MSTRFLVTARPAVRASLCAATLCLICVVPSSAQEALPTVRPRAGGSQSSASPHLYASAGLSFSPELVLATEPLEPSLRLVRDAATEAAPSPYALIASGRDALDTLSTAVRDNDFATFTIALATAHDVAEASPAGETRTTLRRKLSIYDDVQRVWRFSRSDAFGSFYDEDALPGFYAKLSRDYSGYAEMIDSLRIIDSHGTMLFPTAETRTFLLQKIGSVPRQTPLIQLAERHSKHSTDIAAATPAPRANVRRRAADRQAPRATSSVTLPAHETHGVTTEVPVTIASAYAAPLISGESHASRSHDEAFDRRRKIVAPTRARRAVAQQPQPVTLPQSAPKVASHDTTPLRVSVKAPLAPTTASTGAATNVRPVAIAESTSHAAAPSPVKANTTSEAGANTVVDTTGRAIVFILVGLIAIGILGLVLRAPKTPLPAPLPVQSTQMPPAPEPQREPDPLPEEGADRAQRRNSRG